MDRLISDLGKCVLIVRFFHYPQEHYSLDEKINLLYAIVHTFQGGVESGRGNAREKHPGRGSSWKEKASPVKDICTI
jgi:hypothetical protein